MKRLSLLALQIILWAGMVQGQGTARLMSYNLLNYPGSDTTTRNPYFRDIMAYAMPDILVVQEITSQAAVNNFRDFVMNVSGSGYLAGTFIDGPDSDNAIYFKSSKFSFISNTPIKTALRDINEFKLVYLASGDTLIIFSVHLKASSTSSDIAKRSAEVDSLRKYTNQLPYGSNHIVCGDFNIYGSSEPAYTKLLAVTNPFDGHFLDVISMTGTWNNPAYSIYHTQSPRTRAFGGGSTGGMDDRFDMILMSRNVIQTGGPTYVSGSYHVYGNDGNHYNDSINKMPNVSVPLHIANALHYASDHIPLSVNLSFGSQAPLPVSYLDFFVEGEDDMAILKWFTASEKNNTGFHIERLDPGSQEWTIRGFKQGLVNSSTTREYTFPDPLTAAGTYYYRLRQEDLDGTMAFSSIISYTYDRISKTIAGGAYPNPAVDVVNIPYIGQEKGTAILEIYDQLGKLVLVQEFHATVGQQYFNIDLEHLEAGVYHYGVRRADTSTPEAGYSKIVISK